MDTGCTSNRASDVIKDYGRTRHSGNNGDGDDSSCGIIGEPFFIMLEMNCHSVIH